MMCCGPALTHSVWTADITFFDLYHHLLMCPLFTTMARGKALSQDFHWVIVWMCCSLTIMEIMCYTGLKH